jgi:hypothetical protein
MDGSVAGNRSSEAKTRGREGHASMPCSQRIPHRLVALLVVQAGLDIARVVLLRQLEHALAQAAVVLLRRGGEHGEQVARGDARAGDVGGEEDAGREGRVGGDVEVFLAFGVGARGWEEGRGYE